MTKIQLARALTAVLVAGALAASCTRPAPQPSYRTFATPDEAAKALIAAVKGNKLDDVIAIFGPEGQSLIDSSDAATARQNRDVFAAAVAERWRLEDRDGARLLVVGNEDWPFPVPIVKDGNAWRFDTAAGKEEILSRRVGRNELAVIRICHTYVAAQQLYAAHGHDGQPAGRYAAAFRSDPGKQNGLYWPAARGGKRSPLGDLVAEAAQEGRPLGQGQQPEPFHGYYFRILPSQSGFALVAWPAQYDVTGVMTFLVNQDGVVQEKDLGADTDAAARKMTTYAIDESWRAAEAPGK